MALSSPIGSLSHGRVRAGAGLLEKRGPGGSVIIELARPIPSVSAEIWPFQGYRSVYAGTGTAPDDQKFRVRIRLGTVNNLVPANLSQEFTCDASADTYFFVECTIGSGGEVSAVQIGQDSSIPSDPAGSTDNPPAKSYCGIFRVTCTDTAIKEISPLRKASLNVKAVVTAVDCDSNTLALQWT